MPPCLAAYHDSVLFLFSLKINFLINLHVSPCMCAFRGQRRVSHLLGLELPDGYKPPSEPAGN